MPISSPIRSVLRSLRQSGRAGGRAGRRFSAGCPRSTDYKCTHSAPRSSGKVGAANDRPSERAIHYGLYCRSSGSNKQIQGSPPNGGINHSAVLPALFSNLNDKPWPWLSPDRRHTAYSSEASSLSTMSLSELEWRRRASEPTVRASLYHGKLSSRSRLTLWLVKEGGREREGTSLIHFHYTSPRTPRHARRHEAPQFGVVTTFAPPFPLSLRPAFLQRPTQHSMC